MADDLPDTIRDAVIVLQQLSKEERLEAFACFCVHCGVEQPEGKICQCWNDE